MQLSDQHGTRFAPGLEWLEALGDPDKVSAHLRRLRIGPTYAFPVFSRPARRVYRPSISFPIGPWFAKLILEIFDRARAERMRAPEIRSALIQHCDGRIATSLLTKAQFARLILRAGVIRNRGAYERSSFARLAFGDGSIQSTPRTRLAAAERNQIDELVKRGLKNGEIANALGVTDGSVKRHIAGVRREMKLKGLNVPNRCWLIAHGANSPTSLEIEKKIYELVSKGLRNQGIQSGLGIGPGTLNRHLARIYLKANFDRGNCKTYGSVRAAFLNHISAAVGAGRTGSVRPLDAAHL